MIRTWPGSLISKVLTGFFFAVRSPFGQVSPWQPCRRGCSELVDGSQSGCYWLRGTWHSTFVLTAACVESQERGRGGERLAPPHIPPLHLGCAKKKEITPPINSLRDFRGREPFEIGQQKPQDEDSHPPEPSVPCCSCFSPTVSDAELLFQSLL